MIGHNLQGEKAILRMREKILVNHITDKELISKTDKELTQLNSKKKEEKWTIGNSWIV